jgi:hypothetical protein
MYARPLGLWRQYFGARDLVDIAEPFVNTARVIYALRLNLQAALPTAGR